MEYFSFVTVFELTVGAPFALSGSWHVVMAQTRCGALAGRPGQLHAIPRRVDRGGQGAVRAGLQLPREELPPHPADGERMEEENPRFKTPFTDFWRMCARTQLPDKLISSLVKYYYSWKKTRTRTSVMDRQARRLVSKREKDDR